MSVTPRRPLAVQPHPYIGDVVGRPLDRGMIYFGEPDKDPQDYPITVYLDPEQTKPAHQPIRTKGGFINVFGDITEIFADEILYSLKVLDCYGRLVFYKKRMHRDNITEELGGEIVRAQKAESALQSSIDAEAVRAKAAESDLNADIIKEVSDRESEVARLDEADAVLQAQINSVGGGKLAYKTYAEMIADESNIAAKSSIDVIADTDDKNGTYLYDGADFVKSQYDIEKIIRAKVQNTFGTYAQMVASDLNNGAYALVADDTEDKNGIYIKEGGEWVKSAYDPAYTSKLYTDSAVLGLEKRSSISYDALTKYGVIQSVGISSRNGAEFSLSIYESSNYIPVKRGDKLVYTGSMGSVTGIATYNSSKGFLGTLWDVDVDGAVPTNGLEFTIDDEETAYIRGCNRHSDGVTFKMDILASTASELETIKDDLTLLKANGNALTGDADLLTPDKLVPATGINANNGKAYESDLYEATDFIDVSKLTSFYFEGYSADQTGIAGYDVNKSFVEPIYYPTNDGLIPEDGRIFELTNPSIKYIRACNRLSIGRVMKIAAPLSYTASDIAEIDNKLSNADGISSTSSDIIVNFISATKFTVSSKCPDGSYMTHEWIYVERERQKERAWNFRMSSHNGQEIVAGNFNTIHIMNDIGSTDGVDDSIFVGYTHGCEWMLYAQFFLDGVEFDPATATGELKGKEFKCHIVTDNYKPDRDLSIQEAIDVSGSESTAFVMPAQPEHVRSRRVSTVTIEGNNRIKRYHKLTILKDNVQFKCLYMAMQRTYNTLDNNVLYLNDKDGTRNHFPNQLNVVEPLAPSTVTLSDGVDYGDENCFATRFESSGTLNGYAYNIVTTQANVDSSKQNKNHIQMWTSVATGVKVYFIPVYTSDLSRKYSKYSPDVFNTGDVIESYSESEYNITKLG